MEPDKRQLRKLKRDIKRAGNKRRRRALQRDLVNNPDEAQHSEDNCGRFSSEPYNGMDRDSTRRKP
jgi:hypothetical protein